MLSKKLISFLNVLTPKELDKFHKFIQSPYHNEQADLISLFAIIRPFFRKKNTLQQFSKQQVWEKLFEKKAYNDVKIRKLASLLLNLAIDFKSYEILKEQPEQKLLLELKAVSRPELATHIASINRKLNHINESNKLNPIESHFFNYEINIQNHKIAELTKDRKKLLNLESLSLANQHLDIFFLSKKLEIIADILSYQGLQAQNRIIAQEIIKNTQLSPHFQEPIIQVYYLIVVMLSYPEDDANYYKLKKWVNKHAAQFMNAHEKTFYAHLINYSTYKINLGQTAFSQESFELYSIMLDKKLIFNPYIDPDYYKNIISVGLQTKKYDFIQNFIQEYSDMLPPEQKENAETYNLARLYYTQNNYDKVIELLQNVELTNLSYSLGAKTILVATYYALDEYRALESLLISFRIFVLRNKFLAKNTKQGYLNFLKFTKKLLYLAPYDKVRKEKLIEKVKKADSLMGRDWLLTQVSAH